MICDKCGGNLSKVWFVEKEREHGRETGRVRDAVSHLVCDWCGKKHIVDDSVREVRLVISNLGELSINTWVASGPALTKKNKPSGKHSGSHSILVYNINSQKKRSKSSRVVNNETPGHRVRRRQRLQLQNHP